MSTFTFTGLAVTSVPFGEDLLPVAATPIDLVIVSDYINPGISYSDPVFTEGELLPAVEVDTSKLLDFNLVGANGLTGEQINADTVDVAFGFIAWDEGRSVIMAFNDTVTNISYFFFIEGDIPASFADLNDFLAVAGSVSDSGLIAEGEEFGPNQSFNLRFVEHVVVTEDDVWVGTDGADEVSLGKGNDSMEGGRGEDFLTGDEGQDTISGNGGADELYGGFGADEVYGGSGEDVLFGAHGRDDLYGGAGDDFIIGGNGRDLIVGGDGDDRIEGGDGGDNLKGNGGFDTFIFYADRDSGRDRIINWKDGEDTILFFNAEFSDLIIAQDGGNVSITWGGDGEIIVLGRNAADFTEDDFEFVNITDFV